MLTYIERLKEKETSSKEVAIVSLTPSSADDGKSYMMLFQYLSSRNRFGVATVANPSRNIKDGYLMPFVANERIPAALLPFDGPGKFALYNFAAADEQRVEMSLNCCHCTVSTLTYYRCDRTVA